MISLWLVVTLALSGEIANDPAVRAAFWGLIEESRFGYVDTEAAMFVIRNADGTLSFVHWPKGQLPHRAQWRGPVPRGAVAIAHTHPNGQPRPSMTDEETARQFRLPVYVLTRNRIAKTNGAYPEIVMDGDWHAR